MTEKEMQAREKVEHKAEGESTRDLPLFIPAVDIYESDDALTLVADMPGVSAENVTIDVRDNQLTVRGSIDLPDTKERLLAQEYEIGDYYRQFALGRTIDQARIEAAIKDGVLTLTLPKADINKPRKITVKTG
ncbi:Hsp20/alpha crystallin family protein [Syntrophobacter fumaroxidans]|uniref:Heat shock protein Hsp20 n=1 Tax=Syntrophobacter fumaroxidans (strain DSM 10017 / MPOB) TaxID=335543 RepID=A0LJ28_SYNFM|nr:Hsp20/alpha crystallin family protein [Syntrophobacter fumaroxidans]ABK17430.1 heat shock protein Hsp20 [Syntrophobacter fumaroxidans MPOB]